MKLLLSLLIIGKLNCTAYRSVPEQTKPRDPYHTSIGERTNIHGCAVSQDLLEKGLVKYGDLLYIDKVGFRFVNDCMNKRHKMSIDVWVDSWEKEHKIFKQFHNGKTQVYLIRKVQN